MFVIYFNHYTTRDTSWLFGLYLFMAFLLMGRQKYLRDREIWRERHVQISPESGVDFNNTIMVSAAVLIILAWMAPSSVLTFNSYARKTWQSISKELFPQNDRLENIFAAAKKENIPVSDVYRSEMALGTQASQSAEISMLVFPSSPSKDLPRLYWRGHVYDSFEGGRWLTSSVTTESDTATCGPCSDSCAAAGLCAQANQNPDHQLLVCYLNARGFVLAQESEAAVVWKDGVWHRSGTITYFAQTNDPTQTAIVYFGIEVTGETGAYAVVYVAGAPDHGIWVGPTGGVEQVSSPDEMTPQSLSRPDVGVAATSNCTVCEEDCGETCKYYSDIACTVSGVYVCAPAGATGLGAIMCALYWYKVCPVVSKEFCQKTCQRRCCGSDGVCCGGQCCGDRQICCNGECVDDCGGCGACGAGQECQGGECVPQCPPCSEWDSENGGCVNKCKDGQQCCNGTCWEFGCCDDGGGGKLCCPPNCSCCGPAVGGGCQSDCTGSGEPCSATCG